MKKWFFIIMFVILFLPFNSAFAAGSYSVEMVTGSSSNQVIGSYGNYNDAKNAMERANSNSASVATIYKDGVPVDSKYAIFKLKPNTMVYLYRDSSSSNRYTYLNASYGVDAALLGYSENGRVKVMISGFIGWANLADGVVTPISLLSGNMINVNGVGVRVRTSPSLSSGTTASISGSYNFNYTDTRNADGYTWYKIKYNGSEAWIAGGSWVTRYDSALGTYYLNYGLTGNLIHHYQAYSGVTYTDNFTNLGTSPSFLTIDQRYYSFDGNYFYDNLTTMFDDYRRGIYSSSVNSNNPYYSYYMYLPSHSTTSYTAADLDNIITSKGYNASTSKMFGTGVYFKEAEEQYGTNALLAFSAALNESASGTSAIAMNKNNLFGYGAADSCPYDCAYSYSSPRESIMNYASNSSKAYENPEGNYYFGSHYGNKSSGKNVMYASDPYWGEKMAMNAFLKDKSYGGKDFNSNTIGVAKKGRPGAWVFSEPVQTSEKLLYMYKNKNTSDPVYDYSANVIDKVENGGVTFYKIYTDLPNGSSKFGYVWDDEWYVSNNQPEINAEDREIKIGDTFDYIGGVTATDVENGDITNRLTYDGLVDTTKEGIYQVTYTVSDLNNFHKSKTINVNVSNDNEPMIEAYDKEIKQFTEFDYLDGVKAYDNNGDLKVTYDETVDTSKAGDYKVIYKVKNSVKEVSKSINVKVIPDFKPVIDAVDREIKQYSDFNYLDGITALDEEDGNLTVKYEGKVNTYKEGVYDVTYSAVDSHGQESKKTIKVTVLKNAQPTINAVDREIPLNSSFDYLDGVTAFDDEDGNLTNKIKYYGSVDVTKCGRYEINYSVSDDDKQSVSKKVVIKVVEKTLKKSTSEFYFDYLKKDNGKLVIRGYNIIQEIDNTLENSIKYFLIFRDSSHEYKLDASRIIDSNVVYENIVNGKNYTYSWFDGIIDIKNIPNGDYNLYVRSESDDYYAESIVSNKLLNEQVTSYSEDGKYLSITNDYIDSRAPLVFTIRDKAIGLKETSPFTNQYSYLDDISFKDGKLYLKGASYSSGVDMRTGVELERNIVFENKNTFETYSFELGYLDNGPYMVSLFSNDKFGKNKDLAWYEKSIDISVLDKGTYLIYVTNKSNISDFGELKDMLMLGEYNKAKGEYDGKSYEVALNKKVRYRLELTIK